MEVGAVQLFPHCNLCGPRRIVIVSKKDLKGKKKKKGGGGSNGRSLIRLSKFLGELLT